MQRRSVKVTGGHLGTQAAGKKVVVALIRGKGLDAPSAGAMAIPECPGGDKGKKKFCFTILGASAELDSDDSLTSTNREGMVINTPYRDDVCQGPWPGTKSGPKSYKRRRSAAGKDSTESAELQKGVSNKVAGLHSRRSNKERTRASTSVRSSEDSMELESDSELEFVSSYSGVRTPKRGRRRPPTMYEHMRKLAAKNDLLKREKEEERRAAEMEAQGVPLQISIRSASIALPRADCPVGSYLREEEGSASAIRKKATQDLEALKNAIRISKNFQGGVTSRRDLATYSSERTSVISLALDRVSGSSESSPGISSIRADLHN